MAGLDYDRLKELKEFDETKQGVKGIVDRGEKEVPRMFIRSPEDLAKDYPIADQDTATKYSIPVVDFGQLFDDGRRAEMVGTVRRAAEAFGFFHVVNHGVPTSLLKGLLNKVREFHELPTEEKMTMYYRDIMKKVKYTSNFDLYKAKTANWRDTLTIVMDKASPLDPSEVHQVCRDEVVEYSKHIDRLSTHLFELLSEALGLGPKYLNDNVGTGELAHTLHCHYYPSCPQPELTQGLGKHTDPVFITILIKDHKDGLQVLHQNQWVDVAPLDGAFLINIGDFLQLLSNGKFMSCPHRVFATKDGPRVTVASFIGYYNLPRKYGPIKELLSEDNPPRYKDVIGNDYLAHIYNTGVGLKTNYIDAYELENQS